MEEQVTTIEQSQRLWALGVPEQRASMRWGYCDDGYRLCVPIDNYQKRMLPYWVFLHLRLRI